MIEVYTLPLVGKMKDWRALSGDPDDPIGVVAPNVFYPTWLVDDGSGNMIPPPPVPINEGAMRVSLLSVDVETGEGEVEITAHTQFHTDFRAWLDTASNEAKRGNKPLLKRKLGDPKPGVSGKFRDKKA